VINRLLNIRYAFYILYMVFFGFSSLPKIQASTIGIATGSRTVDGRPLLFKNKDRTDNYPSDVNYYSADADEYSYVFQQNSGQNHKYARMGINEAGFGIVYSTSENLEGAGSGPGGSQLAALALKGCASIQDFRDLLDATNGARKAHEHYGVIDSAGAGSLFEVDGYLYVEIPIVDSIGTMANTAKYHPNAGAPVSGSTSPDREARAAYLLRHGPEQGLDYRYFIDEIIKDFSHSQEDEDRMPVGQYYTNPVLSRYKTAAGCVIRGVKPGDDPRVMGVMWLSLSEPSLSIVLPFFPNVDEVPEFIRSGSTADGMAGSSDRVRRYVYNYSNGRYADRYADTYVLMDIRNYTAKIQDSLYNSYEKNLTEWILFSPRTAAENMTNWTFALHAWAKNRYDSLNTILDVKPLNGNRTPQSFLLLQNYPNPFNESTIIPVYLSRAASFLLEVYTVSGQKIRSWQSGRLKSGWHKIHFKNINTNRLVSGIYFYRLKVAGKILTKKMVYLP